MRARRHGPSEQGIARCMPRWAERRACARGTGRSPTSMCAVDLRYAPRAVPELISAHEPHQKRDADGDRGSDLDRRKEQWVAQPLAQRG